MRKYVFLFLSLTCLLSFNLRAQSIPVVYAHRGCWLGTEVPENSVYAVEMAKRYGYTTIECDVHYTKDSVMVIMHDTNDMRRCIRRKADNSKLDGALKLSDINFDDLRIRCLLMFPNTPVVRVIQIHKIILKSLQCIARYRWVPKQNYCAHRICF